MNKTVSLVAFILAAIAGALFVFVFPGAGFEAIVVTVVAGIFQQLGITNWRTHYDQFKSWYQSKSVLGSLIYVVPLVALKVDQFIDAFAFPDNITNILIGVVIAGGLSSLIGVVDVFKNNVLVK